MQTFPPATSKQGFSLLEVLLALFLAGLLLHAISLTLPVILQAEEVALNSSRLTLQAQRILTDHRLDALGTEVPDAGMMDGLRQQAAQVKEGKTTWQVYSAWPVDRPSQMLRMAFPVAEPGAE